MVLICYYAIYGSDTSLLLVSSLLLKLVIDLYYFVIGFWCWSGLQEAGMAIYWSGFIIFKPLLFSLSRFCIFINWLVVTSCGDCIFVTCWSVVGAWYWNIELVSCYSHLFALVNCWHQVLVWRYWEKFSGCYKVVVLKYCYWLIILPEK